ncbi:MAG: Arm DNA-binding domain-containing protein [Alistipes sp.]
MNSENQTRNSSVPGRAGSVYYQITHRQKSVQITTGYKLLPAEWDGVRQCVAPVLLTGGDYYLQKVQRAIDSDLSVLKNAIGALERAARHYTAHDVAQAFRESHSGETFRIHGTRSERCSPADWNGGITENRQVSQFLPGKTCRSPVAPPTGRRYEQWLRQGVTPNFGFTCDPAFRIQQGWSSEGIASQRPPFEKRSLRA